RDRLVAVLIVVLLLPQLITTAIFLRFDTSADWQSYHFDYWSLVIIPIILPLIFSHVTIRPLMKRLRDYKADAWGLTTQSARATLWGLVWRLVWIVLNASYPAIN